MEHPAIAKVFVRVRRPKEAAPGLQSLKVEFRTIDEQMASDPLLSARLQATLGCEPADLRDPREALGVILEAAAATKYEDADILDTLALAYHMTGRHGDAVQTVKKALALLPEGTSPARVDLEADLARYGEVLRRP